jgi:glycosyltransferase involved in cell wall biosynthesis
LSSVAARHHDVHLLNLYRADDRQGGRLSRANLLRTVADARAVSAASRGVDIVHIHTALLPLVTMLRAGLLARAARRAGASVLLHVHSGLAQTWLTTRLRRVVARRVLGAADRLIVVTEGSRAALAAALGAERVLLIDNGVKIEPSVLPTAAHRPPRILYVGVLSPRKGLIELSRASFLLREGGVDHELWLVGGTPEEGDAPEAEVRAAAGDRARFLGVRRREDMPAIYSEADVFCLPSWYEGMPLSLLEAMAAGLPVVATAVGDVGRAVVDSVTGRVIAVHDVNALTSALEILLRDPALRQRMGNAGRERVEADFDIHKTCARVDALYTELGRRPA